LATIQIPTTPITLSNAASTIVSTSTSAPASAIMQPHDSTLLHAEFQIPLSATLLPAISNPLTTLHCVNSPSANLSSALPGADLSTTLLVSVTPPLLTLPSAAINSPYVVPHVSTPLSITGSTPPLTLPLQTPLPNVTTDSLSVTTATTVLFPTSSAPTNPPLTTQLASSTFSIPVVTLSSNPSLTPYVPIIKSQNVCYCLLVPSPLLPVLYLLSFYLLPHKIRNK
jgi:hypothetical protein